MLHSWFNKKSGKIYTIGDKQNERRKKGNPSTVNREIFHYGFKHFFTQETNKNGLPSEKKQTFASVNPDKD